MISTGAGADEITYFGLAGAAIDNGTGADWLTVGDRWVGELTIDDVAHRATIGTRTLLTWTAVKRFVLRAAPGSQASFVGNDTDEEFFVRGTVRDLAAPSTIDTGGGDDYVGLSSYLPTSIDTGDGHDTLDYHACDRADVDLPVAATCLTRTGAEVDTRLSGIESFVGRARSAMSLRGTERAEHIRIILTRHITIRGLGGHDRVWAWGDTVSVAAGRGADKVGVSADDGSTVHGGRGADELRGIDDSDDQLLGGPGRDVAYGGPGHDSCRAEVTRGCEVH